VIQLPRRSVTRFFVPLIDVLILLFCIFLLMPFVSRPETGKVDTEPIDPTEPTVPTDVGELQRQLAEAKRKIERLTRERADLADRMSVTVLEIEGETGKLFAFEPEGTDPRQEVRDQADAQRVIDRQKRAAGAKEAFFLILYPRKLTGFPLQRQIDTYRRWFKDVPHGFDNPWRFGG
jgi:hypothetical protein